MRDGRFWTRRLAMALMSLTAALAACSGDALEAGRALAGLPETRPPAATPAPAPPPPPVIRAAEAPGFVLRSVLAIDKPIDYGEYAWSPAAGAEGERLVVVSIETQRVYVYRGGVEIGRSSMLYGADDKPTPLGTFPILEKDADHVSNLYDAPMPYMLRLTWDGVALHGSEVKEAAATHGCVGLPDDFAALLFAEMRKGDRVIVTKNWLPAIYQA